MIKKIIAAGLYLFIFLLPWQTRLIWREATINGDVWEYGRFSLYGSEIFLWLVLLLFAAVILAGRRLPRVGWKQLFSSLKQPAVSCYWLAVAFIIFAGLSAFWALDFSLAANRWLILLEAGALLALIVNAGWQFEKIAVAWAAAAALQGVFAWVQFFSQSVPGNKWLGLAWHAPNSPGAVILETADERWLRAYGSFPHPNILGGFLVIGLIFLIYLSLIAARRRQRLLILTSLVAIAGGLFFTFSRSAFVALALALILLGGWLYYKKEKEYLRKFLKFLFVSALLLASFSAIYWPLVATRIFGGQRLETHSIDQRISYSWQAADLISQRWLAGFGLGNYTLAVYKHLDRHLPGYSYQPVHNIYLLIWAETGLIGIALFVFLLFSCLARGLLAVAKPGPVNQALPQVIVLACLAALCGIGLFDHYPFTLYAGIMIFWLILALSIKYLALGDKFLDTP